MVTVRLSSWILGLAFLGLPRLAQAQDVTSGTTIYGTGQSATNWAGGTISSGATLRLDDGGTVSGNVTNNGTLQYNESGNITISNTVAGSGTLSLTGSGILTLTGSNTYTGGTTLTAGSVIAYTNAGTNVSAVGSGAVAIGSGSTLELRSQNTGNSTTTINNTFTGTGLLKLSSSSAGGNGNFLGGINGFSGTVELAYPGASSNILTGLSSTPTTLNAPNATLQINNGNTVYVGFYGSQTWKDIKVSGSGNNEGFGAIRFDSNRILTVTGSVSLLGDTTIGTGGGTLNGAITSGTVGTQTLTLGTSNTTTGVVTLSGAIGGGSGSIALNKTQANIAILSGANTYTGATTVSNGILNIRNANALGTTAAGTSVSSGATLQIHGNITTAAEPLTLNGTGASTNGALRNFNGTNTYAGLVTLGAPTRINSDTGTSLTLSNTGTITGETFGLTVGGAGNTTIASIIGTTSGTLTKDGTGTLTLTGASTYTGGTTISAGTLSVGSGSTTGSIAGNVINSGTLAFNRSDALTYAGIVSGTGAVTKSGAGTQTLTGANTYSGGTTISAGTLEVSGASGALTATSAVDINGGALLLSGSAADRISDTAPISLGAATGSTLQLSGAVIETLGAMTLASGIGARVIDFGVTSGVLTLASLSAASNLPLHIWNWSGTTGTGGGTDRLVISGGFLGGSLAASNVSFFSGSGTGLYSEATTFTSGGELVPSVSVSVPEPGTFFPAAVLVAAAFLRRRRGRCRTVRA